MKIPVNELSTEDKEYLLTRSKQRQSELGEVFTPTELVVDILEQLPDDNWEPSKTFLDPTCGNGQFLAAVLLIKLDLGHTAALNTIYGVDLMQDNVDDCRARLLAIAGDTAANRAIVEEHILCKDGLKYDYAFDDKTDPDDLYDPIPETNKSSKSKLPTNESTIEDDESDDRPDPTNLFGWDEV